MHACTIIAKNYLAQARVLADSFLEHNPGSSFTVLVIDDTDGYFDPAGERFTVLTPRDIDCQPFWRMAARYELLELSTAVKPWLLRQQLRAGAKSITYLDPDIQVFGPLEALHERAIRHGLVLTPHNTRPIPDDGRRPTQIDIMIAGVYNLGYVSVAGRPDIDELLDWWCERLTRDCRVDPVYGYFVDQRWFDLAPGFVRSHSIVREPEYNVAYWNAHSRQLTGDNGGYAVDGRPLAFFHFSGFDPATPHVLSRHQTRMDLDDLPVLRQICAEYAERVTASGYREARHWPYTFATLASGEAMSLSMRAIYGLGEDAGVLSASPFQEPGCEALLHWAAEQDPEFPHGVSRTLAYIWDRRLDLQRVFPNLDGESLSAYLDWAREHAAEEYGLPGSLLAPPVASTSTTTAPASAAAVPGPEATNDRETVTPLPRGVNVVGYFRSELGVGEAARQAVTGLDAAGVPLVPVHGATIPLSRQGHSFRHLDPSAARYPVNLICMNADALPDFARHAGRSFFADRISVGLWFWEVSMAPPDGWAEAFGLLDEVWAPTLHVAEAIRSVSPIPVVQVRLPIEMPPTIPLARESLSLRDGFMFMFSFDYLSVFERKNPLAVIDAYCRAIEAGEDATLVIKCINQDSDPDNHARLLKAAAARDDITVIDSYLDPAAKDALTATCDCYVSLHRAEGFGLTMAEAMYLGKPVIATAYSGNLDFMTAQNSYLVGHQMVPIGEGAPPYPADGTWAEPDRAQAAAAMREVFDDRERGRALGARAAASIRQTHSAQAAGMVLRERLQALYESRPDPPREPLVDPALRRSLQTGPAAPSRSAAGAAGPQLRRVVLRAVKPLSVYQDAVNEELLGTVEAIEREVRRVDGLQRRAETSDLPAALHALRDVSQVRHDLDALVALRAPMLERIEGLSAVQQRIEAEARALPYMADDTFVVSDEPGIGRVEGYCAPVDEDGDVYRSFEDVFRGSEDFIRERQRRFLPLLEGHDPVLDFGCGRGEMLDLLRERDASCAGVDSDAGMVDRCRAKGHTEVQLGDGIEYLERCEPASFGAVFCAQVIEHLPYELLVRFFELSRRALMPGGVLIAETVNPHSPQALKTFWIDLTHQHPIFPEVALALSRAVGFHRAFVFHPNGVGDIEVDRYTTGEYAVVAHTAEEAVPAPSAQ